MFSEESTRQIFYDPKSTQWMLCPPQLFVFEIEYFLNPFCNNVQFQWLLNPWSNALGGPRFEQTPYYQVYSEGESLVKRFNSPKSNYS